MCDMGSVDSGANAQSAEDREQERKTEKKKGKREKEGKSRREMRNVISPEPRQHIQTLDSSLEQF